MNYRRIYDCLIQRAKSRDLGEGVYTEKHHINPKCLGGLDESTNLVDLTPEEHYVAHQLLVKLYPGVKGLIYACIAMTGNTHGERVGNKAYGWIRRQVSEARKGTPLSAETRRKKSEWAKANGIRPPSSVGRVPSDKARRNMSASQKGKVKSAEHRKKLSESQSGRKVSDETRRKLSASGRGRPKSEAHRLALSEATKKAWQKRRQEDRQAKIA